MKREIVCPTCAKGLKTRPTHPREHVKLISGRTKRGMFCDACGMNLREGSDCCAFSIYFGDDPPRYDWEDDYITK